MSKQILKLSIYLVKDTYVAFNSCLKQSRDVVVSEYPLDPSLDFEGILYLGKTMSKVARWHSFLKQGVQNNLPELINTSNRALLLVKISDRIFAITFGYGQYLLDRRCIEPNFGLKTSLNSIDPDKLRSLDKASLEELTVMTRVQSSVTSNRSVFDIDVIGDLLTSITGTSKEEELGNTISGTDAFYITPKLSFKDLKPIIQKSYGNYKLNRYKENFDWVDNLSPESNPSVIESLNEKLVEAVSDSDFDFLSLSPPTLLDWSSIVGLSYTPSGELVQDFDIAHYTEYLNTLSDLTVEKLSKKSIYLEYTGNDVKSRLRLWDCLNYQTEFDDHLYVRSMGKWFKVNKVFSERILEETIKLKESDSIFIDCKNSWNEGVYNEALANSNDDYILFDRKNIKCEAARTDIEACDVLTKDGEFIHVKPKNQSSTLSHLFSQGRISAVALISDKNYRKKMRKIIRASGKFSHMVIPLDRINNTDYTITYATITKGDAPMVEKLPFFSRLNLRQSAQFLFQHGFEVRVKKIKKLST